VRGVVADPNLMIICTGFAPGRRAALVLGYAAMREAAIRAGIAELARVL
jgi:DNA-binding transcriptional MocR family regulator